MKKALLALMCLLVMIASSTGIEAQEVTITLSPGWTWISYMGTEPQDFATVLGSFTPEVGDVIKSQWGYASYGSNGQWRGSISQFYPGYGYMYKSARVVPVQLTTGTLFPQVSVTTLEAIDITATSAVACGTVTVEEGSHVFLRGVCWGTEPEPTIDGSHTSGEAVAGSQIVTLSELTPSTTYYVRAYAVSDYGFAYGNVTSFTTASLPNYTVTVSSNPAEGGTATGGGTYEQGQTCTLMATANSGYTFANWTENDEVVSTNVIYTFTVDADRTLVANFTYNGGGDHAYVDLGLPSGLLWVTCNVGADNPGDYGDYFAWGETTSSNFFFGVCNNVR